MPDPLAVCLPDAPCPTCGGTLVPTTVLAGDPELGDGILVEQPGLCCAACGAEALDATAAALPRMADRRHAA